jgi:hypothetical protein
MPQTFRGKAQIAGLLSSDGTAVTFDVILYPMPQSMKLSQEFDEDITASEIGDDCAWRARNEKYTGDLGMKLMDKSATSLIANARTGAAFLAPYAIVTITKSSVSAWNSTYQNVSGGSIDQDNMKIGDISFRLRRYADSTQNTLAATTPG